MKSAVIDAPETQFQSHDALDRRLVEFLNKDYEPVRRLIDRAPNGNVRHILLSNYEACAGYPCLMSIVDILQRARARTTSALGNDRPCAAVHKPNWISRTVGNGIREALAAAPSEGSGTRNEL